MSSRYRDRYDDEPPYGPYNGAARSPRSPRSRQRIPRGGRRNTARWEPKSPRKEDEKKGEFNHEEVEAELSQYKKGVFYFDETLKPSANSTLSNGHGKASPSKAEHSRFQLKLSDKLPPALSPKKSRPLANGTAKLSSLSAKATSRTKEANDDSKDNAVVTKSESKLTEKKKRKKAVVVTQQPSRRRVPRVQPIVTISPQRMSRPYGPSPYGAFVPPRSDYYYASGYPYGAPNAAPSYYDLYPPTAAGYMPRGPPPPTGPRTSELLHPEYSYLAGASGTMGEDGLWYPFPEAQAQGSSFSTPKKQRKSGNAEVDLTSPSKKEEEMSPGRRVNKIQKQLEYYFSPANLDEDEFLRDAMDDEGWVDIDVLIPFKRMKVLKATKELVIEAAFHSTVIEIDHVKQDKVRMTAQWREYVDMEKKKSEKKKKRSQSSREREREKLIQRELDNAEVTESTIDAIVALVEKKQERRAKRRELREREKAKKAKQQGKDGKDDQEKDSEEKEKDEDAKTTKSEATEELIKQDQAKNADADSKGDPDNNDMVEID